MLAPGLKLEGNLPRELNSIHQHLMIPHHILPINLSFVKCCVLHPPPKKKKRNLDSLDARNGAK